MSQKRDQIKYLLYARKSSESEDRQVQSIEDQVNRLTKLAQEHSLKVIKTYTEAKSAKSPQKRPLFDEMMQRIENGEANGLLCWKLDRLSRNPVDSGKICWLLQKGIIESIRTIDREHLPDDNILMFSVESGMANQYLLDLSKNVKRGIHSRIEKGWHPHFAPLGYLNDKIEKTIITDPERFPLIRKMWDLMLTGSYTPPKILDIANKEWGFRTRAYKSGGNTPLTRSGIYKIFTNIFYTGIIEHNGEHHPGKHKSMISLEEYDRVQFLLGRKGKPRPKKHLFPFTGFIRCGECGCLYTAETKKKLIKSTGEVREYTYYHCTRKKREIACTQRKVIREDELEKQIDQELAKYTILPEFRGWALGVLRENHSKEVADREKIYETRQQAVNKAQNNLDRLVDMRFRDLIDDETYLKKKSMLQNEIVELRQQLRETENRADQWLELTEKAFDFATYARKAFLKGDMQTKREILMALGERATIKDGKLTIEPNEWLIPIGENYPALEKEYLELEPAQVSEKKERTEAVASIRSHWLGS